MKQSPERLFISDISAPANANEAKHFARYNFAKENINPFAHCIDSACGSGYGTRILADSCITITGIDIDNSAIDFANKQKSINQMLYKEQISFCETSIENISLVAELLPNRIDTIVSFETLEHVEFDMCMQFLVDCAKILSQSGDMFIGSSPMLRYKNGLPYVTNPYHVNELPRQQLISMIESVFVDFDLQYFHQQDSIRELGDSDIDGFLLFKATRK
jgi:cyclopropane fatty-acyl-phospholipid synthase-like methyltransferase